MEQIFLPSIKVTDKSEGKWQKVTRAIPRRNSNDKKLLELYHEEILMKAC